VPEPGHAAQDVLSALITAAHIVSGDGIPGLLDEMLAPTGLRAELFLVDHEQVELRPLRAAAGGPLRVDGTLPGRSYQLGAVLDGKDDDGDPLLWVPFVDGVERLGVVRVQLPAGADPADQELRRFCTVVSGLTAHVLASKMQQSDALHAARRIRPMSVAGELLWQLLPPLTVAGREIAIAALLEPSYDVSGDAFDYTVGETDVQFGIFDSSGHDLSAGLTTSVTLAASRAARRAGRTLLEHAAAIDDALTEQFADHRFVTGVIAHLDLHSGRLTYVAAGHPAPVLLRAGRAVRELSGGRRMPFGRVAASAPQPAEVGEEYLEPGDLLLLYSDGVVEARDSEGEEFGVERLVELAEHAAADQLPAPETLRRLAAAVREHRSGELRDDATLMLVEWSGSAAARLLPHVR
jgi:sigma-B regulation protein RsbU (phosphoserine phosphatase)